MKQGETIDITIIKLALIVEEWRKNPAKGGMKGKAILHALHVKWLVKGLVIRKIKMFGSKKYVEGIRE